WRWWNSFVVIERAALQHACHNRHRRMHLDVVGTGAARPKGKERIWNAGKMVRFVVDLPLTERPIATERDRACANTAEWHSAAAQLFATINFMGTRFRMCQSRPPNFDLPPRAQRILGWAKTFEGLMRFAMQYIARIADLVGFTDGHLMQTRVENDVGEVNEKI